MTRLQPLGVYVHIPFCRHRCHYCDFNTYEGLDLLHAPYVDALVGQIEAWRRRLPDALGRPAMPEGPATSIFFGGGTPTLLPPRALGRILDAIGRAVGVAPDAEITVEANPETVDERVFESLLRLGFNRFSVGVQATAGEVLRALGRTHSGPRALDALAAAHSAGAINVNADLIYGSPWETPESWENALSQVADAGVQHVSAYALTVEEGTPLGRRVADGRAPDVDPDLQAERWEVAVQFLGSAGFERYETSNWATPGRACSHNLLYWSGGNYLAFGAGAHGHLDGTRWWCTRLPRDFIDQHERGEAAVAGMETLTPAERAGEAISLGLRMTQGLDLAAFDARFGRHWLAEREPVLQALERQGLVERSEGRLRVAPRATFVADDVMARLV